VTTDPVVAGLAEAPVGREPVGHVAEVLHRALDRDPDAGLAELLGRWLTSHVLEVVEPVVGCLEGGEGLLGVGPGVLGVLVDRVLRKPLDVRSVRVLASGGLERAHDGVLGGPTDVVGEPSPSRCREAVGHHRAGCVPPQGLPQAVLELGDLDGSEVAEQVFDLVGGGPHAAPSLGG
jgi:hypothetical protein